MFHLTHLRDARFKDFFPVKQTSNFLNLSKLDESADASVSTESCICPTNRIKTQYCLSEGHLAVCKHNYNSSPEGSFLVLGPKKIFRTNKSKKFTRKGCSLQYWPTVMANY